MKPKPSKAALLAAIEAALPNTYYAALPLPERVAMMVRHWRRLVVIMQTLEEERDRAQSEEAK